VIKTPSYSKKLNVLNSCEFLIKYHGFCYKRGHGEHTLTIEEPSHILGMDRYADYIELRDLIPLYFEDLEIINQRGCFKIQIKHKGD